MSSDTGGKKTGKVYSRRVQKLRRIIVGAVIASCLIPTCFCIVLAIRYDRLLSKYDQSTADLDWYRERFGTEMDILSAEASLDKSEAPSQVEVLPAAETHDETTDEVIGFETDYAAVELSGAQNPEDIEGTRYVYLTFDDGPSSSTNEILDILAEYDVKATFFVCGKPDARYTDEYKRIVDEGHTLGMHSYSHKYNVIYSSIDAFKADLDKLRVFLYETTGVWSKYYRFPGGSSNSVSKVDIEELADYLETAEVTYFDWNVSAGDDKAGANKDVIYNNIVPNIPKFKHCIVLMHDSADKHSTVEALPEIIEAIQGMDDTVIVPITKDTLPVQHIKY